MLDRYALEMGQRLDLPMVFAYAPRNVERRNSSGGGDSPLGNLTAEAMRRRQRVEAEFAVTNTLGIRDNLYAGPITLEGMFNVFPFENTITVMYLSGVEVQELMNFMTERSAGRGCQSQGQLAGATFTMDCGRALENEQRQSDPAARCTTNVECGARYGPDAPAEWLCRQNVCYRNPAHDITINGEKLDLNASYKVAVNDYIAKGGSGFRVLKRNTTRIDTGISLRDALIDSLRKLCTCDELESADPAVHKRCAAALFGGTLTAEQVANRNLDTDVRCQDVRLHTSCMVALDYCSTARKFEAQLEQIEQSGTPSAEAWAGLGRVANINAGRCGCHQVLAHDDAACGHITDSLEAFCHAPRSVPVIATEEDGRIVRRVK
jgi:hypothetical protein